jgi:DNA-binding response OmpR family regulator
MSPKAKRIVLLAKQLNDALMNAALYADRIQSELAGDDAQTEIAPNGDSIRSSLCRPLLDEATLSVHWADKSLHLGHTRAYWLLDRLARRPNQYVTHLDLLNDVWDNEEAPIATLRSAVRHLRQRLVCGGMPDLAHAIRGHNGRYILSL